MRPPAEPPVYLLADSAPLFTSEALADRLRSDSRPEPRVVYVGASGGDDRRFFDLCRAALGRFGVGRCEQLYSRFAARDAERLAAADWIVLAGGDVERGWKIFASTGMGDAILRRRRQGALVLGVSAGAVQLGLGAAAKGGGWLETFAVVPRVIDVHDEAAAWSRLERAMAQRRARSGPGLGIPSGGGVRVTPDAAGGARFEPLPGTVLFRSPADSAVPPGGQ